MKRNKQKFDENHLLIGLTHLRLKIANAFGLSDDDVFFEDICKACDDVAMAEAYGTPAPDNPFNKEASLIHSVLKEMMHNDGRDFKEIFYSAYCSLEAEQHEMLSSIAESIDDYLKKDSREAEEDDI